MSYALVGTIGAVDTGTSGAAITPAWGTSENRTAGNLLILQVVGFGTATLPAAISGWTIAKQEAGTSCSSSIYYKIATGTDAAPTVALVASTILVGQLAEYSGGATSSVLDQIGGAAGTTSPITATNASTDSAVGELLIACGCSFYSSSSGTKTLALTSNNATLTPTTNQNTAIVDVYDFAYGVTTSKSAADTGVNTFSTTHITGSAVATASFKLPTVGTGTGSVAVTGSAAGRLAAAATGSVSASGTATGAVGIAAGYKSVVLSDSPSVLWMLNEASGTTAADATGNGYTGTYNGTITLGSASIIPSDNADTSMECTNSSNNGVILETTTPPTTATSAWSLEGCILTPAIAAGKWGPVVINGGDLTSGGGGYGFGIGTTSGYGGSNLDCLFSAVSWHDSGYALAASTKYHIVLVYTSAAGGTLTWYVNGSNVVTQTGVGTPNTPVYN